MGINRKHALRQIEGIKPKIREHLLKMQRFTDVPEYNHWRAEVTVWIEDVEHWARFVGRRTHEEVMKDVTQWKQAAGLFGSQSE
jgi:hypothetical protein